MNPQQDLSDQDQIKFLVTKFQRKGFDGLTLEELATAMIIPDFATQFNNHTGQDWIGRYEVKARERLNHAHYDIYWMSKKGKDPHTPLFVNCAKGAVDKVKLYLKQCKDPELKFAVDQQKRSPLHLVCQEGYLSIVELLLMYNFDVNARDRTLKTPLHLGCLYGWDAIVDTLIRTGADIMSRDSLGRSSIHFAASGLSSNIMRLLIATKPELVNDNDHKRRTALHYCVYNQSKNQVDMLRTLLQFNSNPNALDEDLKTPLHHASEHGSTRAIPILLQKGGIDSLTTKDRNGNTPIEISANNRTRETIVVYGGTSLQHNQEDVNWMNNAISGNKLVGRRDEGKESKSPQTIQKSLKQQKTKTLDKTLENKTVTIQQQPQLQSLQQNQPQNESWGPSTINEWIREKFFTVMKKVQESGIQANHHLKKPYIYTGSWMEGLNTMEEIFEQLKDISPGETTMRVFNILCPYDRPLPPRTGKEEIIDGFYGEQWYDSSSFTNTKRVEEQERVKRQLQQEYLNRISELETICQLKEKSLNEIDQELAQTKTQLQILQKSQEDNNNKLNKQVTSLKDQLNTKEQIINDYRSNEAKLKKQVKQKEVELETWKNTPQGPSEEEVQQYLDQIQEMKMQLNTEKEKSKQLKYKSGQLFLKAINDVKTNIQASADQQIKEAQLLASKKIAEAEKKKALIQAEVLPENAAGGIENLQDDDSILNLLKALKGNPPPMKQRMKNQDADADDKLTQQEFTEFLKKLKLSDQDVHSLCRIAGFLNGKQLLGIDEWSQILQDRPQQREQWEQKLFCKILDSLKSKGLTIDKFFQLLDTDNSGELSPTELKEGLKSLKIVLNQKDLNNMFCIFDADKSGSIQLQEMKETLEHYEQLRKEMGGAELEDLDFGNRMKQSEDGIPYSEIDINDVPYDHQEGKEWVVDETDITPINGNLKIQIPKGFIDDDSIKAIIIRITLLGAQENVQKQLTIFSKEQDWNQVFQIPIRGTLRENLCEQLIVQLYSCIGDEIEEENFMGDVHTCWKDCLDKPNKWVINNKFKLTNISYVHAKNKMKIVDGYIDMQCKYIPIEGEEIEIAYHKGEPKFIGTIVEEGTVEVTIVQAILAKENKAIKDAKYRCDLKFKSIDEDELEGQQTAKDDIYWERKYLADVKCIANKPIESIYVKVYIDTPKHMVMTDTKVLGEVYINWSECIIHAGKYLSQKSFPLNSKEKVYLKIRYVPKSMFQSIVGFREGVSEKDKKKQLTEEDMQSGVLKVLFVRGKNLKADDGDTSDPYCLIKLQSWKKELKIQSKTIKKSLNPEWRDMQSVQVMVPKEPPFPPFQVEVFDEDVMGDDTLGKCKIDLANAIKNPCTWGVNDIFDLDTTGQVYIQVYFVPKGMKDPNLKAKDKEDKMAGDADPNFIDGSLLVRCVHARELSSDSTPDPYTQITFPSGKEMSTETISSTFNPVWNQTLKQELKIAKEKGTIPIKVFVKDSNFISKDQVIGYVDVDWQETVKKAGDWGINQVYKLSGTFESKGALGSLGYIYLQIKFLERGMIDDNAEAPLVENLLDIISAKQGIWQGVLRTFLVHARDLVKADSGESSDPYVVFKVPGGQKVESQAKKDTIMPSWKTIYKINISMPKDTIQPLRVEVYDDDLVGDELIGYAQIDLLGCFENPQKWQYNEIIDLSGDLEMQKKYKTEKFGKIYIQLMYCLQGVENNDSPLPLTEDLDEILREQAQEAKQPMKGQLLINIPLALGVKAADSSTQTSDPYCEIHLPDGHKVSTKQVEKSLNPIWNFTYKWNCNIIKEQYKPIKLVVLDEDVGLDEKLGYADVEWMECFENPTQWMINKVIPLQGEMDMGVDNGRIYTQMNFIMDGQEKLPEGQRIPDTIEDLKNDYGRVVGIVVVKIVSATQLYNSDTFGKSDPFVEAYLSIDDSKKMKTKVINDTNDPKWDFQGQLYIQLLRCQIKATTIRLDVKDDDEIGADMIGTVDIDLIEILEKNPQSEMIGDYPLKNPEKKGDPNLGSLKVILVWQPDPYNEGVVGLRQPQKTYTGDLYIRFPNARQLPDGDPYVKFKVTHDMDKEYNYKKKNIKSNKNPDFNYEETIHVDEVNERNIKIIRIMTTVMNYNFTIDTTFGGVTTSLTDLFHKPGTWINQYYQLYDDDGKKMESYLYIQAQYRDESVKDTSQPKLVDFNTFINAGKPPTYSGKLNFTYIGLKKIVNMDLTGKSDPFVEIKVSKGSNKAFTTKTQDDKEECFWSNPGQLVLENMTKEDMSLVKMYVNVYDYDYNSNDLIGKIEYDITKLFEQNGNWLNEREALMDEKGFPEKCEVYIQAQWLQDGQAPPKQAQPENLYDEILKKQNEDEEKRKKEEEAQKAIPRCPGKVRVFVIGARQLIKADPFNQSDPLAEIKLSNGDKNVLKTKTIDDESCPKWDYEGAFTLNLQQQEYKDMQIMITVYDYDAIDSNDFLGYIEICIDELFKTPGSWINKIYILKDEHGNEGKNGDIYVQLQWVPEGNTNISMGRPQLLAYDKDGKVEQPQEQNSTVVTPGNLFVNAIRITKYPDGKKSQGKFSIEKNEIKTNLVQSGVDWNMKQQIGLKYKQQPKMLFDMIILDEKGGQIGSTEIDIIKLFQQPGLWINEYYDLQINSLKPAGQKIYVQVQWRPSKEKIDTTQPQLLAEPSDDVDQQANKVELCAPRGKLKIAVIKAQKILLLDGGKTSNTKAVVDYNGDDEDTPKIKGASPQWNMIVKSWSLKCKNIQEVKPIYVKLEHDPGFLKSCIFIGDALISDLQAVFAKPNEWAIDQDYLLGDSKKQSKNTITGSVSVKIGFVPEKENDRINQI